MTAKFEKLLDLESDVQAAQAAIVFMPTGTSLHGREQRHRSAAAVKARLYAAIAVLTPEELDAYGEYRKAEYEARKAD